MAVSFTFTSNKSAVEAAVKAAKAESLSQMGDFAVQMAQNYAPVDTGNMRGSIKHEKEDEDTEIYGTSNDQARLKPVDYAPYVELGTSRMRAQPFIRPAAENHAAELQSICEGVFSTIN